MRPPIRRAYVYLCMYTKHKVPYKSQFRRKKKTLGRAGRGKNNNAFSLAVFTRGLNRANKLSIDFIARVAVVICVVETLQRTANEISVREGERIWREKGRCVSLYARTAALRRIMSDSTRTETSRVSRARVYKRRREREKMKGRHIGCIAGKNWINECAPSEM